MFFQRQWYLNLYYFVLVFFSCLDELTDMIYIYQNWQLFNSNVLRGFSILFMVITFLFNIAIGSYYYFTLLREPQKYRIFRVLSFPIEICIFTLASWTKILEIMTAYEYFNDYGYEFTQQNREVEKCVKISQMVEMVFENIPQLIIQCYNNTKLTDGWSTLDRLSVASTVIAFIIEAAGISYYITLYRNNKVSQN